MRKEEMINEMRGETLRVDGEWLAENDPEMIEWLTNNKYWGKGFEGREINPEDAVLEIHFESHRVAYKATFEGHPEGVDQSLTNQPIWGEDDWEDDWEDDELLEKYYKLIKNNN